jgi:hypothetical protein
VLQETRQTTHARQQAICTDQTRRTARPQAARDTLYRAFDRPYQGYNPTKEWVRAQVLQNRSTAAYSRTLHTHCMLDNTQGQTTLRTTQIYLQQPASACNLSMSCCLDWLVAARLAADSSRRKFSRQLMAPPATCYCTCSCLTYYLLLLILFLLADYHASCWSCLCSLRSGVPRQLQHLRLRLLLPQSCCCCPDSRASAAAAKSCCLLCSYRCSLFLASWQAAATTSSRVAAAAASQLWPACACDCAWRLQHTS